MTPFFPTLVAFTTSAITHLHEAIRADGISFLAFLSNTYPALTAQYMATNQIMIDLISVLGGVSLSAGKMNGNWIAPISRFASIKMRYEVVRLLARLFYLSDQQSTTTTSVTIAPQIIRHDDALLESYPFFQSTLEHPTPLLRLFQDSFASKNVYSQQSNGHFDESTASLNICLLEPILSPVLVTLWIENYPDALEKLCPDLEKLALMASVVKVLYLMWRCMLGLSVIPRAIGDDVASNASHAQTSPLKTFKRLRLKNFCRGTAVIDMGKNRRVCCIDLISLYSAAVVRRASFKHVRG